MRNILTSITACLLFVNGTSQTSLQKIEPVSFSQVNITDKFWKPKIDLVATKTLDACIYQTEIKTPRIRNFEKVARAKGEAHEGIFYDDSDVFKALEAMGAKPQRLLWASTGTKSEAYSDVKYVKALIGPNTVNTLPMQTLDAFRDHGKPSSRLEKKTKKAQFVLDLLNEIGIDLKAVSQKLEEEGIEKFVKSFNQLLHAIDQHCMEEVAS